MKRYINFKGGEGIETVDELDSNDFPSVREFKKELWRLKLEYAMAFKDSVYISQRSTKTWKL